MVARMVGGLGRRLLPWLASHPRHIVYGFALAFMASGLVQWAHGDCEYCVCNAGTQCADAVVVTGGNQLIEPGWEHVYPRLSWWDLLRIESPALLALLAVEALTRE